MVTKNEREIARQTVAAANHFGELGKVTPEQIEALEERIYELLLDHEITILKLIRERSA